MTIATKIRRPLGTMITYGFPRVDVRDDLAIALRLGAEVVEILPAWKSLPDPTVIRALVAELGLVIHSAHGCWGGQSIRANKVDLGSNDPATRSESIDDLRRCIDWLGAAGGSCLVIHPGGLSDPEEAATRAQALTSALVELADHAAGTGVSLCVENMPPGVYPGSRMAELADLVGSIARPEVALALDTGHANISSTVETETFAAGRLLRTTHVHDNDGRHDAHLPPGQGSVPWVRWVESLDATGYRGPVVLECIRHLRDDPGSLNESLLERLRRLTGVER